MPYFIILGLILSFFGLFYKYPKLILPFLIFAVPLQRYSVYIEPIRLSLKLIMIVLPAAYLAIFVRRKIHTSNKFFLIFSSVLIVGEAFSLINSINVFRSISVIAFSCLTLSYAYIFSLLVKTRSDFERVLKYLLITGSLISVLGLWQFFRFNQGQGVTLPLEGVFNSKTITAESFEFSIGEMSYLRPSSAFVDVNLTAGFLTIIVLLNFAFLINNLTKNDIDFGLWKYLFLFILNFSAFLLTVSRSGYLGLAVGGWILFILNAKSFVHRRVLVLCTTMVLGTVLLIVLVDTPIEAMWGRFQDTFLRHDTTGSTQEHELFSESALGIFKESPLFGIGAGNFEEYYLTRIDATEDTAYTYNVYLGFLSEMGLVGFFGQIAFIVFVIYSAFRSLLKTGESSLRLQYSALLGAFVAILVANVFYAYYILFFVWLLIGLLLAFSFNKLYSSNEK